VAPGPQPREPVYSFYDDLRAGLHFYPRLRDQRQRPDRRQLPGRGPFIFTASLYADGNFTTIDAPAATGTYARGINNSGEILGSTNDPGFFIDAGGIFTAIASTSFGIPSAKRRSTTAARLWDLSATSRLETYVGFLYAGGTFTPLGDDVIPHGINDSGEMGRVFWPRPI